MFRDALMLQEAGCRARQISRAETADSCNSAWCQCRWQRLLRMNWMAALTWCWCASCVRHFNRSLPSDRSMKAAGPILPRMPNPAVPARSISNPKNRHRWKTIRQRRNQYTPIRPRLILPAYRYYHRRWPRHRCDMISALHSLRARNPARLICAVPVAPPDTLKKSDCNGG